MILTQATIETRKDRKARHIAIFALGVLLMAWSAAADDATKPAERKRHGGIKPFTKAQIDDFLAERRNATIATINKDGLLSSPRFSIIGMGRASTFPSPKELSNMQTSSEIPG